MLKLTSNWRNTKQSKNEFFFNILTKLKKNPDFRCCWGHGETGTFLGIGINTGSLFWRTNSSGHLAHLGTSCRVFLTLTSPAPSGQPGSWPRGLRPQLPQSSRVPATVCPLQILTTLVQRLSHTPRLCIHLPPTLWTFLRRGPCLTNLSIPPTLHDASNPASAEKTFQFYAIWK